MLVILTDILICILAAIGAVSLVNGVASSIRRRVKNESPNIRLIIAVKDQQDTIEGVIRNIFAGDFLGRVMSSRRLMVMDMGSRDETLAIVNKLKESYEFIDVVEAHEKEKILNCLDE